jgi:hypothetical protein
MDLSNVRRVKENVSRKGIPFKRRPALEEWRFDLLADCNFMKVDSSA